MWIPCWLRPFTFVKWQLENTVNGPVLLLPSMAMRSVPLYAELRAPPVLAWVMDSAVPCRRYPGSLACIEYLHGMEIRSAARHVRW